MADLIDRQGLLELVEESKRNNTHKTMQNQVAHKHEHEHFMRMIDGLSAVDAVEVVRCRDCKWYERMMYSKNFRCCRIGGREAIEADDFCSYGERREENAAD